MCLCWGVLAQALQLQRVPHTGTLAHQPQRLIAPVRRGNTRTTLTGNNSTSYTYQFSGFNPKFDSWAVKLQFANLFIPEERNKRVFQPRVASGSGRMLLCSKIAALLC